MIDVGTQLGRYTIVARLGIGGMATLFLGRQEAAAGFTRHVAIKVVHPHLARDPQIMSMFVEEAKLSARIRHPNAVHVEELGETDGTFFLVMEHVHGTSLARLQGSLARHKRRLPAELCVHIAMRVLDALHAAHELADESGAPLSVVHRDVSPQNVLLSTTGHVKLIDFGIAKSLGRNVQTAEGTLLGKLRYMAPEQMWGPAVDRRADVYSLAVVLWEMLTMRRIHAGIPDRALLEPAGLPLPERPGAAADDVPPALDDLVLSALSRAPDGRPPTALAFLRGLGDALPQALRLDDARIAELLRHLLGDELAAREAELPPSARDERSESETLVERPRRMTSALEELTRAAPHASLPDGDGARGSLSGRSLSGAWAREPAAPLLGREADLLAVLGSLGTGTPLVTIVGPPGAGKTRLAKEIAARLAKTRRPVLVALDAARSPADLVTAMAAALRTDPGGDPDAAAERLHRALASRKDVLPVLDGAERLSAEARVMLGRFLGVGPTLLATSREALGLAAEEVHALAPLGPDAAVALFRERALRARAGVKLDGAVIGTLVERLDRLPLAIELAAARATLLEPAQILERLDRRFELLRQRSAPEPRHAGLAACLDASFELLSEEERAALAWASVFRGGVSIEAAEAVLPSAEVLSALERLATASLAHVEIDRIGEGRLRLYESVRDYGAERLAERGEDAEAAERHARYFVGAAERWARVDAGLEPPADLDRLEANRDDLLAVLDRRDILDPPLVARVALALDPLLLARGPYDRHLPALQQAIAGLGTAAAELRGLLLVARGRLRWVRGDAATDDFDAAVALAAGTGSVAEAEAHRMRGLARAELGDVPGAIGDAEKALALWRTLDVPAAEAVCESVLMLVYDRAGRWREAPERGFRALGLHRASGHRRGEAITAVTLGVQLIDLARDAEARQLLTDGERMSLDLGDQRIAGLARVGLAIIERDPADRSRRFDGARACFEQVGDARGIAVSHGYQACLLLRDGDDEGGRAAPALARALAYYEAHGYSGRSAHFLAAHAVATGDAADPAVFDRARERAADRPTEVAIALYAGIVGAPGALDPDDPRVAEACVGSVEARIARDTARRMRPSAAAVAIADDGAWFELYGRDRVDLRRRDPLRRILRALVAHHGAGSAEAIGVEALIEAGWPAERMLPEAGANRVYTAVRTLRRMGLGKLLLTRGRGYMLDPTAIVRRVAAPDAES